MSHIFLDEKRIEITNATKFRIQLRRGKARYKTKYAMAGNFAQAYMYYRGINNGYGWIKRLTLEVPGKKPVVLARCTS